MAASTADLIASARAVLDQSAEALCLLSSMAEGENVLDDEGSEACAKLLASCAEALTLLGEVLAEAGPPEEGDNEEGKSAKKRQLKTGIHAILAGAAAKSLYARLLATASRIEGAKSGQQWADTEAMKSAPATFEAIEEQLRRLNAALDGKPLPATRAS